MTVEVGAGSPVVGPRTVRPVGDRALLVECADLAEVHGLHAALVADPLPGQGELLPAARTVLVRVTDPRLAGRLARGLAVTPVRAVPAAARAQVVLDTVYDGEDLSAVAAALGMSVEAVVRAHGAGAWTAAFVGFAPGFAYLERDGSPLDVARHATPRTRVPAGSVALAGRYSAVYPRASPGGWQLVGRTPAVLWDLTRPEPALVRGGTRVVFRAVRDAVAAGRPGAAASTAPPVWDAAVAPVAAHRARPAGPALEVLATGAQSLVEDLGRPGHAARGVGASGALDRRAATGANRLVGNPRGAAVVETVLGGLTLRARGRHVLAVTGAPAPVTVLAADGGERSRPEHGSPFGVHDGETVHLDDPPAGLRSYLAVRGGLGAEVVLGSRATDVLSGLGPAPLAAGDVLPVLPPPGDAVAAWPDPASGGWDDPYRPLSVRVRLGPRAEWLTTEGVRGLVDQDWTVSPESNRVGLRLGGQPLTRASVGGTAEELPSEGVVAGAVQVPASGLPVVFLADHPVTGGYPVVAVVLDADLDRLAQVRPGERLRFVPDAPGAGVRA